ncbi:DUF6980 family protein [Cognatishimia maritima]|uniref:DUF6980 domain-containing protein n=1 Tax=Cognatishimia maritima TaxID=870908 RepID=A0A1M5MT98_9RHOB|nr:hypothetical protein SAMN04488044_1313 [Cognatishimia maritima]
MSCQNDYCCTRLKSDLEQTCALHADRFECPDALINKSKYGYGIIIHDGGSSSISISFCPWYGTKLDK